VSALTEQVAALEALRQSLPLTDPDRHALDLVDAACCRMPIHTPDAEVITVQRRAALLKAIKAEGGRWKSGRAIRLYEHLGYGRLGRHRTTRDLLALSAAGHLVRHETSGVRYFTLNTPKDPS
jgi:hypothetical protein